MPEGKELNTCKRSSDCGVLYVATGEKYINEAIQSATSCKQHNSYPIALVTNSTQHSLPPQLFDYVIIKDAVYSFRDKLLLRHSPFEKTIFLDTDTLVIGSLGDLFTLLDYREFAVHQQDEGYEYPMPDLSAAMPEFNTGVIAFRKTETVIKLFADWDASFDVRRDIVTDQYHLRKTLYASDVKFAIFSSAYNFIVSYNNYVIQHVKVLHGRPFSYLQAVASKINDVPHESAWRRTFYPFSNRYFILYANPTAKDSFTVWRGTTRIYFANFYRRVKNAFK